MEYLVLYTHQKTKKAKTWQDGVLTLNGTKGVLYDDKKSKLDSMHIKPDAIVKGEQIETDRYYILIEEEKGAAPAVVEPVRPVPCPVKAPIRTGLKRKRTGFVPPRVIKQQEPEPDVSRETANQEDSYLELLRKRKCNVTSGFKSPQTENILHLYSNVSPVTKAQQNNVSSGFQSPQIQNSTQLYSTASPVIRAQQNSPDCFDSPVISRQTEALSRSVPCGQDKNHSMASTVSMNNTSLNTEFPEKSIGSVSDLSTNSFSNQSSPWSSYGSKLKSINKHRKSCETSPLISQAYGFCRNDKSDELSGYDRNIDTRHGSSHSSFSKESLPRLDQNSTENTSQIIQTSEGLKDNQNVLATDSNLSDLKEKDNQHMGYDKPHNSSKRSMSQILGLLGKGANSAQSASNLTLKEGRTNSVCDTRITNSKTNTACDKSDSVEPSQEISETFHNREDQTHSDSGVFNKGNIQNQVDATLTLQNEPQKSANKTEYSNNLDPGPEEGLLRTEDGIPQNLNVKVPDLSTNSQNIESSGQSIIHDDKDFEGDLGEDIDMAVSFDINFSPLSHVSDTESVSMDVNDGYENLEDENKEQQININTRSSSVVSDKHENCPSPNLWTSHELSEASNDNQHNDLLLEENENFLHTPDTESVNMDVDDRKVENKSNVNFPSSSSVPDKHDTNTGGGHQLSQAYTGMDGPINESQQSGPILVESEQLSQALDMMRSTNLILEEKLTTNSVKCHTMTQTSEVSVAEQTCTDNLFQGSHENCREDMKQNVHINTISQMSNESYLSSSLNSIQGSQLSNDDSVRGDHGQNISKTEPNIDSNSDCMVNGQGMVTDTCNSGEGDNNENPLCSQNSENTCNELSMFSDKITSENISHKSDDNLDIDVNSKNSLHEVHQCLQGRENQKSLCDLDLIPDSFVLSENESQQSQTNNLFKESGCDKLPFKVWDKNCQPRSYKENYRFKSPGNLKHKGSISLNSEPLASKDEMIDLHESEKSTSNLLKDVARKHTVGQNEKFDKQENSFQTANIGEDCWQNIPRRNNESGNRREKLCQNTSMPDKCLSLNDYKSYNREDNSSHDTSIGHNLFKDIPPRDYESFKREGGNARMGLNLSQEVLPSNPQISEHKEENQNFFTSKGRSLNGKQQDMIPSQALNCTQGLHHPDYLFSKKLRNEINVTCKQSEDSDGNTQYLHEEPPEKDLRCTASEKLQGYIMKGSISSGAVRRNQRTKQEPDFVTEDESFYIDLNTDKPHIQRCTGITSKFLSSPAQFVPNSPDFLQRRPISPSPSPSSLCTDDEQINMESSYYRQFHKKSSHLHQQKGNLECHLRLRAKTPMISAPDEDQPSRQVVWISPDNNMANQTVGCEGHQNSFHDNNDDVYEVVDKISCESSPTPILIDSGQSDNVKCDKLINTPPQLSHWEEKLLQRQRFGNVFIRNDEEQSPESPERCNNVTTNRTDMVASNFGRNNTVTDGEKRHNKIVLDRMSSHLHRRQGWKDNNSWESAFDIKGDNSSQLDRRQSWTDNMCRNNNSWESATETKGSNSRHMIRNEESAGSGSKWGKYADFDEEDDDFLTFDQSFSFNNDKSKVTSAQEQTSKYATDNTDTKFVLRPPTSHNDSMENIEDFCDNGVENNWLDMNSDYTQGQESKNFKSNGNLHIANASKPISPHVSSQFSNSSYKTPRHNVPSQDKGIPINQRYMTPSSGVSRQDNETPSNQPYMTTPQILSRQNIDRHTPRYTTPNVNRQTELSPEVSMSRDSPVTGGRIGLGRQFKCPVPQLTTHVLKGSKRNLGSDLQFPSEEEVTDNTVPTRQIEIPTTFSSLTNYKQVFIAALREHLNIILYNLSVKYHHALSKIDTSTYLPSITGKENKGQGNSNPVCKCGAPSKMIQVKKAGPNHNRFFFTCNAARNNQCKFFQWADDTGGSKRKGNVADKMSMSDPTSITTFIRSHHVHFYCDCSFLKKSQENIMNHFKRNVPNWVLKQKMGIDMTNKKKMYIQLSKKDSSSLFSKDDLWIISQHLDFRPSSTILCKSTYFGPMSGNEVEIEPISSFCPSNWPNEEKCHAILAGNVSGELSYLENLENLSLIDVPIMSSLLSSNDSHQVPTSRPENRTLYIPETDVDEKVEELVTQYKLNDDQTTALIRISKMFTHNNSDNDVLLIHGVFGAGKSFLLSVVVLFLVWLFERNHTYTPGVPFPWKLMIASTTNVAVDRILNGLLDIGYEDFVRVGSVKKISKPVLPFSVHATGSDSQELKDLQMMLRSGELTSAEKQNVRQSIEKHRLGENKKKLSKVRVVGVTCASSSAACLKDQQFPVVLLDECSQMTEPASMLPIARFKGQKLVLVGDPKQLDPTIQGSETATEHGLEQTLFDRLTLMGHHPVMLHTQYRCHPHISQMSNTLFYGGVLRDGVGQTDRPPVMEELPALGFYDVSDGIELIDSDGSFYNEKEADFIQFLINVLIYHDVEPERIGVISLYKSQMYKIINLLGTNKNCKDLKGVMLSTVDAFQGGERDIIILSSVRTKHVGFIDNEKRINVALTRARNHLLIIGNEENLHKNKLWGQIIKLCKESSYLGVQQASDVREKYKLSDTSQERKSQVSTNSPPMSLTDSGKSGGVYEGSPTDIVTDLANSPNSTMLTIEDTTDFVHESTKYKPRRKRRKIDASLLDIDGNNDTDDELPDIFNT